MGNIFCTCVGTCFLSTCAFSCCLEVLATHEANESGQPLKRFVESPKTTDGSDSDHRYERLVVWLIDSIVAT